MSKKSPYVTKAQLEETLDSKFERFRKEFRKELIDELLERIFARVALREDLERVENRVSALEQKSDVVVTTLDALVKQSNRVEDELVVLRASHQQLKDVLVSKKIVTSSEIAV